MACLAQHHKYENCRVGNWHPAESADIVNASKVHPTTVSDFLKREFPCDSSPRAGYVTACKAEAPLLHWFMVWYKDHLPVRTASIDDYDKESIREAF